MVCCGCVDILILYTLDYRCFWWRIKETSARIKEASARIKETSGVVCPHLWKKIVNRDSVNIAIKTNHPRGLLSQDMANGQMTPEVDFHEKEEKWE